MDADRAVDLIVQADLPIGSVLSAGQLDAIHAQVGLGEAGPVGMLGINLGQRDERAGIAGPVDDLWQLVDRGAVFQHWPRVTRFGRIVQRAAGTPR